MLMRGQFAVLLPLLIFPLPSRAKGTQGNTRAERGGGGGMGDREIKKEGRPIQGEAQIWPFPILGTSLGNWLETSLAQKRHKKLKEDGVARSGRPPPKVTTR